MEQDSRFYTAYPSSDCQNEPREDEKLGCFEDLIQFVGIGFMKDVMEHVVKLFDWSNEEEKHLSDLTLSVISNSMIEKNINMCVTYVS